MVFLLRLVLMVATTLLLVLGFIALNRLAADMGVAPIHHVAIELAVIVVCALGVAGCWWLSNWLKHGQPDGFHEPPAFTGDQFEARVRQRLQGAILLALVLLGGACVMWALREPGLGPAVVTAIIVGVTLFVAAAMHSMYRNGEPPALRMDTHGLTHPWYGRIPWSDVHGMNFQETRVKATWIYTMVLGVNGPDHFLDRMPWIARLMHGRSLPTGQPFGALRIPLNPLDKPPHEIYAAAWALRHRVQPALSGHWLASTF